MGKWTCRCGQATVSYTHLEQEEYIIKNPIRRIKKIKTEQTVKETYTDEHLEIMRDNCENLRDLAMIDLLASTGMRVGELVQLNRSDIDFEKDVYKRQGGSYAGGANRQNNSIFIKPELEQLQKEIAKEEADLRSEEANLKALQDEMAVLAERLEAIKSQMCIRDRLRPILVNDGQINFGLQDGIFKKFCQKAKEAQKTGGQDNFEETWTRLTDAINEKQGQYFFPRSSVPASLNSQGNVKFDSPVATKEKV